MIPYQNHKTTKNPPKTSKNNQQYITKNRHIFQFQKTTKYPKTSAISYPPQRRNINESLQNPNLHQKQPFQITLHTFTKNAPNLHKQPKTPTSTYTNCRSTQNNHSPGYFQLNRINIPTSYSPYAHIPNFIFLAPIITRSPLSLTNPKIHAKLTTQN